MTRSDSASAVSAQDSLSIVIGCLIGHVLEIGQWHHLVFSFLLGLFALNFASQQNEKKNEN